MNIAENLERVEQAIAEACRGAGRAREDVELMAVSKTYPAETIAEAAGLGLTLFGENRVQEFAGKADAGAIADTQRTTQQRMIADQTVASDQHRTLDVGAVADAAADADTHRAAYRGLWRYVRAWIEVGLQ